MADKYMNGPESFAHPVTGVKVGPFEWYEGFAHTDFEKENFPVDAVADEWAPETDSVDLEKSEEGETETEKPKRRKKKDETEGE